VESGGESFGHRKGVSLHVSFFVGRDRAFEELQDTFVYTTKLRVASMMACSRVMKAGTNSERDWEFLPYIQKNKQDSLHAKLGVMCVVSRWQTPIPMLCFL
jgi:hypothetical protein